MRQLAQKLSDGKPFVLETPEPTLERGEILVRNYYSVVSSGTEGATVRSARKSLVGKALERPKEVKAVLELFRRQGALQTYRAVMKKLDAYSPLGYSSAGKVIAVGEDVVGFAEGDLVACAGVGYANHAEIVAIPQNLCVKLDPQADLRAAAYNTLGAIALQGVRQADLRLGESCAVIGLGIVGALACLLLKASGVKTIGIDVSERAVENVKKAGIESAWTRNDPSLEGRIERITDGLGVDAVIVAAGTSSLDPINFAGKIARKKGRVVVLGAVPTGFDRNPDYYPKELELRMSCSYGPGRYDLNYEEKGVDYPPAYVRWTEKRNMQAFQDLLLAGRVSVDALTSHIFSLEDSPQAYEMILQRTEPFLGVLIQYDVDKEQDRRPFALVSKQSATPRSDVKSRVGYAFVGAGSYAQGSLLPNIPRGSSFRPVGVLTRSGSTSKRVAEKFGFEFCASQPRDIFENDEIDVAFVATRHNLHASFVLEALKNRKHVFVEKPLCLTLDEFCLIKEEYERQAQTENAPKLMVGFNRRFAPLAIELKKRTTDAPMSIVYRVNSGFIPANTWIQDPEIGGGRILGEACHFIDFIAWLAGSKPRAVYAAAMEDPNRLDDVTTITLKMENGSIGTVHYFANGSKALPKERVEVYQSGRSGVLDDFRRLTFYGAGSSPYDKKEIQNKGQAGMLRAFLNAILTGDAAPISSDEIFRNTLATFAVRESLVSGREIPLV